MRSSPASGRSKTCLLTVELPEDIIGLLAPTPQEASVRLAELALIELFRQGEVSSGWAAAHLGMSKDEFLDLLARHDVPYLDLPEDELSQQVQLAMPKKDRSTH